MSERPDKQQMMKIVAPALAAAVVIVLVGVFIANRNEGDTTAAGNGKGMAGLDPTGKGGGDTIAPDTEGLTFDKPSEAAPEWKDAGEGLKVWDVKEGTGNPCKPGATVSIHYTGWTLAGTIFDSSVKKGAAANFSLTRLIPGWQKGIPGMKPGGIRRLYIPWQMAYGEGGNGSSIPPKADLIFEIKYFGSTN